MNRDLPACFQKRSTKLYPEPQRRRPRGIKRRCRIPCLQAAPPAARRSAASLPQPAAEWAGCDAAQRAGPAAAPQAGHGGVGISHSLGLVHIPRLGWGLDSTFTHRLVLSGIKQTNAVHLVLGCRAAQERRAAGSDVGGGRTRHAAVWRRHRFATLIFTGLVKTICADA